MLKEKPRASGNAARQRSDPRNVESSRSLTARRTVGKTGARLLDDVSSYLGKFVAYPDYGQVAVDYVRLRDSQKEKHAVALKLIGEEWGLTESTVKRICTRERCKGARQYLAWQENEAGPHMQETIQEIRDRLKAGERAV